MVQRINIRYYLFDIFVHSNYIICFIGAQLAMTSPSNNPGQWPGTQYVTNVLTVSLLHVIIKNNNKSHKVIGNAHRSLYTGHVPY